MDVPSGPRSTHSDLRWAQPFQSSGVLDTLFPAFGWLCYSDLPQVSRKASLRPSCLLMAGSFARNPFPPSVIPNPTLGTLHWTRKGKAGPSLTLQASFHQPPQLLPPPQTPQPPYTESLWLQTPLQHLVRRGWGEGGWWGQRLPPSSSGPQNTSKRPTESQFVMGSFRQ